MRFISGEEKHVEFPELLDRPAMKSLRKRGNFTIRKAGRDLLIEIEGVDNDKSTSDSASTMECEYCGRIPDTDSKSKRCAGCGARRGVKVRNAEKEVKS